NYINSKKFSQIYGIKENTLTYYVDQIVENELYPIKFFKIKVPPNNTYYFQENEKLESMLRAITEEHITKITYLNKLFSREKNSEVIVEDILGEICDILFNKGLKKSLREFLLEYINYLAFKIETERELKETYDKLEGIIWQDMAEIFKIDNTNNTENQYKQEIREIDEQIKIKPKKIDLYFTKIRIILYLGQFSNALNLLNELVEIFPENKRDILIKKASVLKNINEIEDGLKIINELLEENPNDSDLLVYKAYWLQYMNKKEESLNIVHNLIKNNPDNGMYYDTYGEILMYSQEYQLAIEQFEKVIELVSDEWYINQTYIKLGICYKELKDNNLAIEYLKKGKELTRSASIEYQIKQKWLRIANIFLKAMEDL
ncbi:MAG: tetratricopeptide repeat protein, partial [Promethearchaeota archaeon]